METLKPLKELLQPDSRNQVFVRIETHKTRKPLTLEEHYTEAAAVQLSPTVPEDVRSYFVTIQNLHLYAYFSYDLYALVVFLSFTAIEMALRKRLPLKGKDRRGLKELLRHAINQKMIVERQFFYARSRRSATAQSLRIVRAFNKLTGRKQKVGLPKDTYEKILLESLPKLRNAFAHPRSHAIFLPGEALFQLRFAAEFINQLFPAHN